MQNLERNADSSSTQLERPEYEDNRSSMRTLGRESLLSMNHAAPAPHSEHVKTTERILDRNLEHAEVTPGAISAINLLSHAGYEAYLVGGFVRDALLGKIPKDEDLATNATPEETTRIFEANGQQVIPSGIEFGTVTVLDKNDNQTGYEITTFRADGQSSDGRHPDAVIYSQTIEEDLARRDFTMNAIAFNPLAPGPEKIVDPYGGIDDLANGMIRSVGDPEARISEDKLRMLRAARFAAQKDLTIDPALSTAIKNHSPEITSVSWERISAEMTKIILSDRPELGLSTLQELGLLPVILPEISTLYQTVQNNPWHLYNVGEHTAKAVASSPKNFHVRMAALFHDIGKPLTKTTDENGIDHFIGHDEQSADLAKAALKRLRLKNEDVDRICKLIALHDKYIQPTEEGICRFIERNPHVNPDEFEELIALKLADNAAQNPEKTEKRIAEIHQAAEIYQEIVTNRPYRIQDLALNGHDVMQINETRRGDKVQLQGKAVGVALQKMLSFVLRHPEKNTPEDLTDFLRSNLKSIYNETK